MPIPRKGLFTPKYPEKYVGDVDNIVYRSGLELRYMKFFDEQANIINWGSEELAVPYYSQVDGKQRRYFPDFIIRVKDKNNALKCYMIEIKPKSQTLPPKTKKNSKRYLKEAMTWQVNQDKWTAATKFCQCHGMVFIVLHEDHLKSRWD